MSTNFLTFESQLIRTFPILDGFSDLESLIKDANAENKEINNEITEQMLFAAYNMGKREQALIDEGRFLASEGKRSDNEIYKLELMYDAEWEALLSAAREKLLFLSQKVNVIVNYILAEVKKADSGELFPGTPDLLTSLGRKLGTYRATSLYIQKFILSAKTINESFFFYTSAASFFGTGVRDLLQKKIKAELSTQKIKEDEKRNDNEQHLQIVNIANNSMTVGSSLSQFVAFEEKRGLAKIVKLLQAENAKKETDNEILEKQKNEIMKVHKEAIKRFDKGHRDYFEHCLDVFSTKKEWHLFLIQKFSNINASLKNDSCDAGECLQWIDMSNEIVKTLDELIVFLKDTLGR